MEGGCCKHAEPALRIHACSAPFKKGVFQAHHAIQRTTRCTHACILHPSIGHHKVPDARVEAGGHDGKTIMGERSIVSAKVSGSSTVTITHGSLQDVNIPMDHATGKHRGFGFIEYEDKEDSAAAIENMHNAELFGRVLKTNYAQPMKIKGGDKGWSHQPTPGLSVSWPIVSVLAPCTCSHPQVWADADRYIEGVEAEEELSAFDAVGHCSYAPRTCTLDAVCLCWMAKQIVVVGVYSSEALYRYPVALTGPEAQSRCIG
eukprot:1149479-Pelagomonas_calceolata.AAC.2